MNTTLGTTSVTSDSPGTAGFAPAWGGRPSLAESRAYCEYLTKTQARNFYYGLKLLPEPKRSAMFALYAWMRLEDDIADEEDGRTYVQRVEDLEGWRQQTRAALEGRTHDADGYDAHILWPAFSDMAQRHGIPPRIFDDVIAGQRQDLQPEPFDTFEQLYEYCYRVAGTVGLASIYVWGFEGGLDTELLAVERGVAFQLTNILRDLREDAARGRTYLPREELAARRVLEDDLRTGRGGEHFREMMRLQIARAESYYDKSADLERCIEKDSRATLVAMTAIYRGLLRKLAVEPERVLKERVSLSIFTKLMIGWRAARTNR
jgi:phytoene synthase